MRRAAASSEASTEEEVSAGSERNRAGRRCAVRRRRGPRRYRGERADAFLQTKSVAAERHRQGRRDGHRETGDRAPRRKQPRSRGGIRGLVRGHGVDRILLPRWKSRGGGRLTTLGGFFSETIRTGGTPTSSKNEASGASRAKETGETRRQTGSLLCTARASSSSIKAEIAPASATEPSCTPGFILDLRLRIHLFRAPYPRAEAADKTVKTTVPDRQRKNELKQNTRSTGALNVHGESSRMFAGGVGGDDSGLAARGRPRS